VAPSRPSSTNSYPALTANSLLTPSAPDEVALPCVQEAVANRVGPLTIFGGRDNAECHATSSGLAQLRDFMGAALWP